MAKRRTRRKTNARRKTTTRRVTARANPRRRRRRAPARKRTTRRRRRNPKFDFMGTLVAGLGGAAVGGGAYALEGVDMKPEFKAAILGGGGIALGVLASAWSTAAGAGLAGAGAGIAVKMLLDQFVAKDVEGMGRIPGYAYNKFGATPSRPHYMHTPNQMYAQLDAVQADLGAVQADLGAVVYADLY